MRVLFACSVTATDFRAWDKRELVARTSAGDRSEVRSGVKTNLARHHNPQSLYLLHWHELKVSCAHFESLTFARNSVLSTSLRTSTLREAVMAFSTASTTMTKSAAPAQIFHLRHLPQELQDRIIEHAVAEPEPIRCWLERVETGHLLEDKLSLEFAYVSRPRAPRFAAVDKKARRDVFTIFWRCNTFCFHYDYEDEALRKWYEDCGLPGKRDAGIIKDVVRKWIGTRYRPCPLNADIRNIRIKSDSRFPGYVSPSDLDLHQQPDRKIVITPATRFMRMECLCALREAAARFSAQSHQHGRLLSFCAEMEEAEVMRRWLRDSVRPLHALIEAPRCPQCGLRRTDLVGLGACMLDAMDLCETFTRLFDHDD